MPYFELLPFLPYEDITDKKDRILFQCPTSSFFLFYVQRIKKKFYFIVVSMPYFELLPFLLMG